MPLPSYIKTQGISLRTIPYSETSCITKIFTPEHGVISCLIRGIRKKSSKQNLIYYRELSILNLELKKNKHSDLYNIEDVNLEHTFSHYLDGGHDINKPCIYMFLCELINKCIKDDVSSDELYDFLYSILIEMDRCDVISCDFHLVFMIQFAKYFGLAMNLDNYSDASVFDIAEGVLTKTIPEHKQYIPAQYVGIINEALLLKPNERISGCTSSEIRRNTISYLEQFYQYHFPNFQQLKSTHILRQILEG